MTLPQHLSKSFWWGTPENIILAARETMGSIDLDPASCARSNEIVKAKTFFDIERNGFTAVWNGNVFLNPPGGKCDKHGLPSEDASGESSTKAWWFKLAQEWNMGHISSAVFLGYSMEILQTTQVNTPETEVIGRRLAIPLDFPLCFPSRRISFLNEENKAVTGNTHASVIVFLPDMGRNLDYQSSVRRFKKKFREIGRCIG